MQAPGTIARRYAPFLILGAVQLLLVAMVPSVGGPVGNSNLVTAGPGAGTGTGETGYDEGTGTAIDPATGAPVDPATGGSTGGTSGSGGTVAGGTTGGAAGGPAGTVAGQSGAATGDRSKCAKDGVRQQTVIGTSPPCVPKFTGDNGGATYQGVTKDTVTVLRYRPKANQQVDAILRLQGLASSPEEEAAALETFAKFFEKHYEFHNRKVKWIWHQGTCEISPPDLPCFRDEVKRLNTQYKPFMVFWNSATTQAEFFEQWSQLGVPNVGGWHFTNEFNVRNKPYHYDVFMDGTRTVQNIAEFWCKKMAGKNATYAGTPDLRAKKRKLGILTQDFAVTRKNALDLKRLVTGEMCGSPGDMADPVYTPSDIATAQQNADIAMQKLKNDGVTTVVLLVDPIQPRFSTQACTNQQWYPEHLLSGSGLLDYDVLARLYDQTQWVNAFGPSHLYEPVPFDQSDAAKAARDVGGARPYSGANLLLGYMSLVAAAVQMGGPNLTPANVQAAMEKLPASGGWERSKGDPTSLMVKFGKDDYTAIEDSRRVYWSPTATSKVDGQPNGAYISYEGGRRYELGTWPQGEAKG